MFDWVYDGATHHCDKCGWDGVGWEIKGNSCPKCHSNHIKEII